MANQLVSSSSFSSTPSWIYDVFLSFRGEDTRTNFTDHLYHALVRNGINTFIDCHLTKGEEISPALLQAIEESRISIIVLSEKYVSSRWCLDELVHILECRKSRQQIVWPVFYKVDPSHVRNHTGSFGEAFTELECKFKDNKKKILAWRSAVKEAANLSGYPLKKEDYEATLISNIVKDILLIVLDGTYLDEPKYQVGIQSCVQKVKDLLGVDGNGRRVVGIWGTSGIGKTTIAKAVYNAIAHKFQGSCFLGDVRESSTSREGLIQLQKTFLSTILRGTEWEIVNVHRRINLIKNRLRQKKILLILDDVDQLEQIKNWVDVDCFGEGSRVIITTKDRSLLDFYGGQWIYEVKKLEDDKALELFNWNAFEGNIPPGDYLSLARRAIAYAQGLPLALNIIGSHLRNKCIDRWQAILDGYDSYDGEPYTIIEKILRKTYDAWDYGLQQVFLDIACFFNGENKDYVLQILGSSTLNVRQDCIKVLIEKAIITIEDDQILMHDLLQKMGKQIVYEESPTEPGKRSRLWFHEDVCHVLTANQGTKKIRSIVVELPKSDEILLNPESFLKMENLEIFINRNANFSGRVDCLPNSLRWIDLGGQSKHTVDLNLSSNFHPRNLVCFEVPHCSSIRQLNGFKNFAKLTRMNLSGCEFLEKIPDLCGSPNIRELYLSDCTSLVEVDDSVGFLDKLQFLVLSGCSKLTRFPTRLGLRSLQTLWLDGCRRLETNLPRILVLEGCNLSESDFLGPLDCWSALTKLWLSRNNFVTLPDCISKAVNLEELYLTDCKRLREIPVLPPKLKGGLLLDGCTSLEKIPKLPPRLELLELRNCFGLSGDEVAKLENNLLNGEIYHSPKLKIIYPGNEVLKWFNYTSNHPTTIQPEREVYDSEFRFEIPLKLQVGETLTGLLAVSFVLEPSTSCSYHKSRIFGPRCEMEIAINRTRFYPNAFYHHIKDLKATHVSVTTSSISTEDLQGDICQVGIRMCKERPIKRCGVHVLLRNQNSGSSPSEDEEDEEDEEQEQPSDSNVPFDIEEDEEQLHLPLRPPSSLGKRPRPRGSSDIVNDAYDQQQQWLSSSSEPADDHPKRRQIDPNVPFDIEEDEKQEQPTASDDPQFLIS
ncbi:disease resistance protein RPV1-like isoform X19 [Malus sylvestris]|uniref:disease resistance protein RPV1-like isoform X19 n=1 Tax=Malus sylvestris TaxID=3752 RepID=UPI0021ACB853|nr:disease resistance protein RPV1-like isoform X19 [Malus sylvestris]